MSSHPSAITMATPFRVRRDVILGDKDGHLSNFVWSSSVMFCLLLAWFGWMQYQEHQHPRVYEDLNVNFEFFCPPPEPAFRVRQQVAHVGAPVAPKIVHKEAKPTPVKIAAKTVAIPVAVTAPPATISVREPVADVPVAMVQPKSDNPPLIASAKVSGQAGAPVHNPTPGSTQGQGSEAATPGQTGEQAPPPLNRGDQQSLTGSNFGATDLLAAQHSNPLTTSSMGNIRPYTRDMIARIGTVWHPSTRYGNIALEVSVNKEGTLLSSRIVDGSGDGELDKSLEEALHAVQFAPLPDWYRGEKLKFKIVLSDS